MRKIKNIVKGIVPFSLLNAHRKFKKYEWRIKILEDELKRAWLLEKNPTIKSQKEILRRKEFQISSQTGEDGIINYIFEKIGTKNKTFVEIGIEDGRECNTANLSMNFGWKGLLVEGNKEDAKKAKEYYKDLSVRVVNAFVSKENINGIIKRGKISGEIDLLSIDIDGNDYWVWKEIDVIKPRVVVIEYNTHFGMEPVTVKYNPLFERFRGHRSGYYYGASLPALAKLGESKGYILIGCNTWGFNAFFVRKKDAKNYFHKVEPKDAEYVPIGEKERKRRFELIKHLDFTRI